jgi:cytochrome o ubiquinol oxidase subunit 2
MSIRRLAITLVLLALVGCDETHLSFLDPQGPIAAQQRTHFLLILSLVMVVVLPVLVLTPLLIWRYRYGGRATYRPKWEFSKAVEVVIWGVPVLIVGVLAVLLWRNTTDLDPWKAIAADEPPLRIQVVGYDWKWLFIYPDEGMAVVGELVVPSGRPLAFELTSDTVMQSFWIPALGSQIYAMGGGMVTRLHLMADDPGVFKGANTQYNGEGFHEQTFETRAVTPEGFEAWVAGARDEGVALDAKALSALEEEGTVRDLIVRLAPNARDSLRFFPVADDAFDRVVTATSSHHPRSEP